VVEHASGRDAVRDRACTVLADRTWVTPMTDRDDRRSTTLRTCARCTRQLGRGLGRIRRGLRRRLDRRGPPCAFELADITVPVHARHGEQMCASVEDGLTIAAGVRRGCPHCRHYVRSPEILEQLTEPIPARPGLAGDLLGICSGHVGWASP
jgi:hypothetical protein